MGESQVGDGLCMVWGPVFCNHYLAAIVRRMVRIKKAKGGRKANIDWLSQNMAMGLDRLGKYECVICLPGAQWHLVLVYLCCLVVSLQARSERFCIDFFNMPLKLRLCRIPFPSRINV
jgi:hypothetical protein